MADNELPIHRAGRGPRAPVSGHLFTVKDVADASGLPQPAIGELVGRTWTDQGWMFTADQMQLAIDIAAERRAQASPAGSDTRWQRSNPGALGARGRFTAASPSTADCPSRKKTSARGQKPGEPTVN